MPTSPAQTHLGFHYFPDTLHYRRSDLAFWLPKLKELHASYLVLCAHPNRAIPEDFIAGLLISGITPILHIGYSLNAPPLPKDTELLIKMYASWGVEYIKIFDRPNIRQSWNAAAWTQDKLVERFLDIFLPIADILLANKITPVFPVLEPGGDYWDTAFLRFTLEGIQRRGQSHLLQKLILSAKGYAGNRPLTWGAGGPERWPASTPYHCSHDSEDQIGFNNFDWYIAISRAVLGTALPIFIMEADSHPGDHSDPNYPPLTEESAAQRNFELAQWVLEPDPSVHHSQLTPLPPEIKACNFDILTAEDEQRGTQTVWFSSNGMPTLPAQKLLHWLAEIVAGASGIEKTLDMPFGRVTPIQHYLLLPIYTWGISDWHLEMIRPFVKNYHPTIGFSVEEALLAQRVTLVGGRAAFPKQAIELLIETGCRIEELEEVGTFIAS
jgi:hypothetical protein